MPHATADKRIDGELALLRVFVGMCLLILASVTYLAWPIAHDILHRLDQLFH